MFIGYIYRHCIINDKGLEKSYIGQTTHDVKSRWLDGKGYLHTNFGDADHKFARAIRKYGWNSFSHEVILTIECNDRKELEFWLNQWEAYYIYKFDSFNNGYNSTTGGDNYIRDIESRKKISQTRIEKQIAKGDKNPFWGQKHNEQTRNHISKSRKGKCTGEQHGRAKKVICLNTGEVFDSAYDATKKYGGDRGNLILACQGKKKSCRKHPETGEKLRWMYYDEYIKLQKESENDK